MARVKFTPKPDSKFHVGTMKETYYIRHKKNWRLVAILSLIINVISISYIHHQLNIARLISHFIHK